MVQHSILYSLDTIEPCLEHRCQFLQIKDRDSLCVLACGENKLNWPRPLFINHTRFSTNHTHFGDHAHQFLTAPINMHLFAELALFSFRKVSDRDKPLFELSVRWDSGLSLQIVSIPTRSGQLATMLEANFDVHQYVLPFTSGFQQSEQNLVQRYHNFVHNYRLASFQIHRVKMHMHKFSNAPPKTLTRT